MHGRPAKSLWHNLGAFFGNIAAGVAADPSKPPARLTDGPQPTPRLPDPVAPSHPQPAPQLVAHRVQEAQVQTPQGPVLLRRTVIDEVVPGESHQTIRRSDDQ
ncbi:MAG: hypothetical protein ACREJO_09640 [Phycisphaerales bacterium]